MTLTAEAKSEAGPDTKSGLSPNIIVGGNYRILPDAPLREYDRPGAPAYVAQDDRSEGRRLLAYVCDPGVLPRVDTLVQLKTLREANIIRPLAWDPVAWPHARQSCFAIVYEHPEEAPLMSSLRDRVPAFPTEFLVASVLGPLSQTLALMNRRSQTHRSVSPDNIYRTGNADDSVVLGDSVTSPPAWGQPVCMEPIEVGMTPRESRGPGAFADDIYALGASILFLALGWCPVVDLSDEDIIEAKTEKGSFMALLNGERPPVGLREPLRGMLSDDPRERWVLDDIEQWIGGDMRRSAQPHRQLKSDRAFDFNGTEHRNCRILAREFGKKSSESMAAIRSKEFESWIVRGVADMALMERITEILMYSASQQKDSSEDITVSKICVELDPLAPLRYKGVVASAQGMGPMLASAMERNDRELVQAIADCIAKGLPGEWLKQRAEFLGGDFNNLEKEFRRLQQLLKHTGPGYGVERMFYEMNPFVPCRSEFLKRQYIYSLRDLLPALENAVRDDGELPTLVDRHISAFIAARLTGKTERILTSIEDGQGDSLTSNLAMVQLLGEVQKDYGPETLPNLTGWLSEVLSPAIDQFQSRSMREGLKRKLESIVAKGRLLTLHDHLNSKQQVKRDRTAKAQAAREFADAASKIEQLVSKKFQENALRTGWGAAAGGSIMLSILTVAILIVW